MTISSACTVIIVPLNIQNTMRRATMPPTTLMPSRTSRFESSLAMLSPLFGLLRLLVGQSFFVRRDAGVRVARLVRVVGERLRVQVLVDLLGLAVDARDLG